MLVVNDLKESHITKWVFMMDGTKIMFFHNLFMDPVWKSLVQQSKSILQNFRINSRNHNSIMVSIRGKPIHRTCCNSVGAVCKHESMRQPSTLALIKGGGRFPDRVRGYRVTKAGSQTAWSKLVSWRRSNTARNAVKER